MINIEALERLVKDRFVITDVMTDEDSDIIRVECTYSSNVFVRLFCIDGKYISHIYDSNIGGNFKQIVSTSVWGVVRELRTKIYKKA